MGCALQADILISSVFGQIVKSSPIINIQGGLIALKQSSDSSSSPRGGDAVGDLENAVLGCLAWFWIHPSGEKEGESMFFSCLVAVKMLLKGVSVLGRSVGP